MMGDIDELRQAIANLAEFAWHSDRCEFNQGRGACDCSYDETVARVQELMAPPAGTPKWGPEQERQLDESGGPFGS